jgi:Methyl-accepting chemotaxis protein
MFHNITIKTRLIALIGFMSALLLIIGAIGFTGTVVNHRGYTDAVEDTVFGEQLALVNHKIMDSRLHILMARINPTAEIMKKEAATVDENNVALLSTLDKIDDADMPPEEARALENYKTVVRQFVTAFLQPTAQALAAGQIEETNRLWREVAESFYAPLKQARSDLTAVRTRVADTEYQNASSTYSLTRNLALASILAGLAIAALSGVLILRSITAQVEALKNAMLHIQSSGDLSHRAEISADHEIGQIGHAFNTLMENFRDVIRLVTDHAGEVSSASTQLAQAADEVFAGSQAQRKSVAATAEAVQAVMGNIDRIAGNTAETVRITDESSALCRQGEAIVQDAAAEMEKIAASVTEISHLIASLGERSGEISGIVQVIREIADQTNLLALNAAIEAARAGEQGRGFAVVADEVRKLAERTSNATAEISAMIASIQAETTDAVSKMQSSGNQVHQGVTLAREAGEALEKINLSAQRTVEMVNDIDRATREQSSANGEISGNIGHISEAAENTDLMIGNTTAAAHRLEQLSRELASAVARFRI